MLVSVLVLRYLPTFLLLEQTSGTNELTFDFLLNLIALAAPRARASERVRDILELKNVQEHSAVMYTDVH